MYNLKLLRALPTLPRSLCIYSQSSALVVQIEFQSNKIQTETQTEKLWSPMAVPQNLHVVAIFGDGANISTDRVYSYRV